MRLVKDDTQIVIDRHVDGTQSTVPVPIRRPGQLVLLDALGVGFVVTGSHGAGTGHVCLFQYSSAGDALADVYSATGSDFVGVGYAASAQRLYLLDSAAGEPAGAVRRREDAAHDVDPAGLAGHGACGRGW